MTETELKLLHEKLIKLDYAQFKKIILSINNPIVSTLLKTIINSLNTENKEKGK